MKWLSATGVLLGILIMLHTTIVVFFSTETATPMWVATTSPSDITYYRRTDNQVYLLTPDGSAAHQIYQTDYDMFVLKAEADRIILRQPNNSPTNNPDTKYITILELSYSGTVLQQYDVEVAPGFRSFGGITVMDDYILFDSSSRLDVYHRTTQQQFTLYDDVPAVYQVVGIWDNWIFFDHIERYDENTISSDLTFIAAHINPSSETDSVTYCQIPIQDRDARPAARIVAQLSNTTWVLYHQRQNGTHTGTYKVDYLEVLDVETCTLTPLSSFPNAQEQLPFFTHRFRVDEYTNPELLALIPTDDDPITFLDSSATAAYYKKDNQVYRYDYHTQTTTMVFHDPRIDLFRAGLFFKDDPQNKNDFRYIDFIYQYVNAVNHSLTNSLDTAYIRVDMHTGDIIHYWIYEIPNNVRHLFWWQETLHIVREPFNTHQSNTLWRLDGLGSRELLLTYGNHGHSEATNRYFSLLPTTPYVRISNLIINLESGYATRLPESVQYHELTPTPPINVRSSDWALPIVSMVLMFQGGVVFAYSRRQLS